jgi:hypothetical protein
MTNEKLTPLEVSGRGENTSQLLAVVGIGTTRPARPITNLARVFGQFAEVQQQVAEQVIALEESLNQERQDAAAVAAELPELKERINWLIAGYYEQAQVNARVEERINRQHEDLAAVAATVQSLCDSQNQWQGTVDQLIQVLLRARPSGVPVTSVPEAIPAAAMAQISA